MDFTDREWTLDALLDEALKDLEYYRASGGGVTVSGGEPLGQHEFVRAFFEGLRERGVHTALDTCGLAPQAALEAVLAHTDLVLFDLKLIEPALHERHTGQPNDRILANLIAVAESVRAARSGDPLRAEPAMRLWIRTPLIPGVTATEENLAAIGAFICERLAEVTDRWELCAFNSACHGKYHKLGLSWPFADTPLMQRDTVEALKVEALSSGFPPERLVVSGMIAAKTPGAD